MLESFLTVLVWGAIIAAVVQVVTLFRRYRSRKISVLIQRHFRPTAPDAITVSERRFPFRVRADLQRGIDRLFESGTTICRFCGVQNNQFPMGISLADCIIAGNPLQDPRLSHSSTKR